ncbi:MULTISPECIES: hypothetical protein [unclassified Pseudomonas]|uniref:hypothetical protein n=1 Tax=unclassified Pseudomonas TaxID=196821 RepID=UPI0030D76CD8
MQQIGEGEQAGGHAAGKQERLMNIQQILNARIARSSTRCWQARADAALHGTTTLEAYIQARVQNNGLGAHG